MTNGQKRTALREIGSYLLIVAVFIFLVSASYPVTKWFAGMPPDRFQGDNKAIVVFTSDVPGQCGVKTPDGINLIACHARTPDGGSIIALPNPCQFGEWDWYARVACHEIGHAAGWPSFHGP